ncbi:MAG: polysaccharide deacetylase family protein [bacterium]|nr:polysaccharide deacetylase family protein [bacterium]
MRTITVLLCVGAFACMSVPAVAVERLIALTFDDGPSPETTLKLLDILKRYGVCATFFVIGNNAKEYPGIVEREKAECHVVANHSMTHPHLRIPFMSEVAVASQFGRASNAIAAALKLKDVVPAYARVPGCAKSRSITAALSWFTVVKCGVDPRDWVLSRRSARLVANYVLANATAGEPVLLHDIRPTTVAAVPAIIEGLWARGFRLVTVAELYGRPAYMPKSD